METTVLVGVIGFTVLALLCGFSMIESWRTRRIVEAVFGGDPGRAQPSQGVVYLRETPRAPPDTAPPGAPPAPAVPGTARAGAARTSTDPAPGAPGSTRAGGLAPAEEGGSAARRAREPFKPPSLAPPPNYAEQARRPAPDAEEVGSTSGNTGTPSPSAPATRQTVRPPALPPGEPELHHGAPETTRKPGAAPISRERPAVTPRLDLATLARDLDAADQAPADQVPEARDPTTRPPPSSQQAPAAGIVAAGLGERPQGRHEARSERPPPHRPPQPARKPTLLGIPPPATARPLAAPPPVSARLLPAVAPPPPRPPEPPPRSTGESLAPVALGASPRDDDFDFEDEATRVGPRPAPGGVGSAAGAQEAPPRRRIYATLASMPSIVPANRRPPSAVSVIEAAAFDDDEQRATLKPGDATAPAATP